jgi:predicted Zn-dependent protease
MLRQPAIYRRCWTVLSLALLATGCLLTDRPADPFVPAGVVPAGVVALPSLPEASLRLAARVDSVGQQLLAANPQIGAKPIFRTIGKPEPEVFHRGADEIYITEGLVRQCPSDGELAAVLAVELGKIVSEREAALPARFREPRPEPIRTPLPGDVVGARFAPDMTDVAAMVKFDRQAPLGTAKRPAPPNPHVLAEGYLAKAGYSATDLTKVRDVLRTASNYNALERQITAAPPINR